MPSQIPFSGSNLYRALGYEEPDEMLARSHLMLDIVAHLQRLRWDLPATLDLLQMDRERYYELLGGRVRRFDRDELTELLDRVSGIQETPTTTRDAVYINRDWLDVIRRWFADIAPVPEHDREFDLAYRGQSSSQGGPVRKGDVGDKASLDLATALDALLDPRYQWLPTLLRSVGSEIELILQYREPTATADATPPEITLMLMGQPATIVDQIYSSENHALSIRVAGKLPSTDCRIAVTPTEQRRLEIRIEPP